MGSEIGMQSKYKYLWKEKMKVPRVGVIINKLELVNNM